MEKIRNEFLENPSFSVQELQKSSSAAVILRGWIVAMAIYDEKNKVRRLRLPAGVSLPTFPS